jgi:hypothetical protein
MVDLRERLKDPSDRFSRDDIYKLFELLAEDYGFHRDPRLPAQLTAVETASIVVPHFEDLGPIVVRPSTVGDSMIRIPSLVDRILKDNFEPSQNSAYNASCVALAQAVVIAPVGIIDTILSADATLYIRATEDGKGLYNFFWEFSREYQAWIEHRAEEAKAKKLGTTSGKEPAS